MNNRTPNSLRAILLLAFLLPAITYSSAAAAATPAGESNAGEPLFTLPDQTPGVALDGPPNPLNSPNPSNMPHPGPAHPEENGPYLRPATGSGRVVPQVEYLPGPRIRDIGSI